MGNPVSSGPFPSRKVLCPSGCRDGFLCLVCSRGDWGFSCSVCQLLQSLGLYLLPRCSEFTTPFFLSSSCERPTSPSGTLTQESGLRLQPRSLPGHVLPVGTRGFRVFVLQLTPATPAHALQSQAPLSRSLP